MRFMKLAQYMSENKIIEAVLAKKLNKHRSVIGRYRSGKVIPPLRIAKAIQKITKGAVTMEDWT